MKKRYDVIYQPSGAAAEYSELAANLYEGCTHSCKYCYVPQILHIDRLKFHARESGRATIVDRIERDIIAMKAAGDRRRVMMCFTCDPYPRSGIILTSLVIELFAKYNQPFQVLTKAGMTAAYDFDLYKPGDAFAATLTLHDVGLSNHWEPCASDPRMRIQSLYEAKKRGIETWASMEPVIIPDETYKLYDATKEFVDRYAIGKMNHYRLPWRVDWRRFALEMIERCTRDGKAYYIKKDLRKYIEEDLK